ncbi:hypothetical protein AB0G74_22455 [Streptomyces sp. NPDC020875]|uniref:hypothetical protein n=1 Tax=Streptomyces sp. NPDC020875 TaxID=3154898 RepID=UPI0034118534
MTVGDLIDYLSALDQAAPVRLAVNPYFPMAHRSGGIVEARDENGRTIVFLADSGDQLGPLPPDVAVRLTWQEPTAAPVRPRGRTTHPGTDQ